MKTKLVKDVVNVQVCTDAALEVTQILIRGVIVQTETHAKCLTMRRLANSVTQTRTAANNTHNSIICIPIWYGLVLSARGAQGASLSKRVKHAVR